LVEHSFTFRSPLSALTKVDGNMPIFPLHWPSSHSSFTENERKKKQKFISRMP